MVIRWPPMTGSRMGSRILHCLRGEVSTWSLARNSTVLRPASKRWRQSPTVWSTSGVVGGETVEEALERHYLTSPADRFAGQTYIFSWLES